MLYSPRLSAPDLSAQGSWSRVSPGVCHVKDVFAQIFVFFTVCFLPVLKPHSCLSHRTGGEKSDSCFLPLELNSPSCFCFLSSKILASFTRLVPSLWIYLFYAFAINSGGFQRVCGLGLVWVTGFPLCALHSLCFLSGMFFLSLFPSVACCHPSGLSAACGHLKRPLQVLLPVE